MTAENIVLSVWWQNQKYGDEKVLRNFTGKTRANFESHRKHARDVLLLSSSDHNTTQTERTLQTITKWFVKCGRGADGWSVLETNLIGGKNMPSVR